ncbi:MAG: hypothetical protein O9312_13035 [Hylemonella sp.]|nr:hypothetical protein [Hylemonella sp.]
MLLRIVYDHSLEGVVRRLEPGAHQTLRKVRYTLDGSHKPSSTTERLIACGFVAVHPPEMTMQVLRGELRESELPRVLPWRVLVRGMDAGPSLDESHAPLRVLAGYMREREAFFARLKHHERANRHSPERRTMEGRWQAGQAAWRTLNPSLSLSAFLLVEEILHGIAHFDVMWAMYTPQHLASPASRVLPLLEPKYRPMGHWLQEVGQACGVRGLRQLHEWLFQRDLRYKNRHISLDLLKKWSASRQFLMPFEALAPMLSTVPNRELVEPLEGRYFLTRLLTYLLDLVSAGSMDNPPDFAQAQAYIKSRYTEVHRLQC